MTMTDTTTEDPRVDQLEAEVAELRQLVTTLLDGTAELVVRRLAVADENGVERIAAEARDRYAELRVSGGDARDYRTAVVMAVEENITEGTAADLFISGGGDIVGGLKALRRPAGWDCTVYLDDRHGHGELASTELAEPRRRTDDATVATTPHPEASDLQAEVIRLRAALAAVQGWALEGLHPNAGRVQRSESRTALG